MTEPDEDNAVPEATSSEALVPPPADLDWLKLQDVRGVPVSRDLEGHQPSA